MAALFVRILCGDIPRLWPSTSLRAETRQYEGNQPYSVSRKLPIATKETENIIEPL